VTGQATPLGESVVIVSQNPIPLIDVFAGPGGLNEGFSRLDESTAPRFSTIASFEMDPIACETLRIRSTYRQLLRSSEGVPDTYYDFIRGVNRTDFFADPRVAAAWKVASSHVHQIELGPDTRAESDARIRAALSMSSANNDGRWALIGGPPCQAYSLAGRSRRTNDADFEKDKKHFLYEEYLNILRTFAPPVFVMENVKGMLSSRHAGSKIFDRIIRDLREPKLGLKYTIHALAGRAEPANSKPSDYIIKAEKYGVPQRRHRVILLGVRNDLGAVEVAHLQESASIVTVGMALEGMPKLRSGISPAHADNEQTWYSIRDSIGTGENESFDFGRGGRSLPRPGEPHPDIADWLLDDRLSEVIQHESRAHMVEDLKRYRFAAIESQLRGHSVSLRDFPDELLPAHQNARAEIRPFEDRFRVQVSGLPSTTVVSHIAKDGHYYIHPDPAQMRSLTVREAARLQTFPDNYLFAGTRTQQYHQVGNAVPPLLARRIAAVVSGILN
jgi:DNA (cytosine-5)-methyltransferase 1